MLPSRAVAAIHLRHRIDRLENMALWPFDADITLGDYPDVRQMPPRWNGSPGAWGCRCSHVRALTIALNQHWDSIAVFEDDASFHHDFSAELANFLDQVPADWDALWLGGQHLTPPVRCTPCVVRCTYAVRTHAYVVRMPALSALLRLFRNAPTHIDEWALAEFQERFRVYAPRPMLVGTCGGYSDVKEKDQPATWWR